MGRKFLRGLWGSISFRLTLNYGLLAILTTLILIAFIYFQAIGALRAEYSQQITAAAQRLTVAYEEGGAEELISVIELTLSDRIDSDREVYLLLDEHGRKLAGNLDTLPQPASPSSGVFEARVQQAGMPKQGYLRIQTLASGETLVVGHDLSEMGEIASLIGQAIMAAIMLAAILVLLGTYLFRRELEYRVSRIRRTTQQIGAGQLSQRVPASAVRDEFTLLNRDINAMLDQIEFLMKSVRHISDTIAHNLRTPLTRIMAQLRMAQRPDASMADAMRANQYAIEGIEDLNILFGKLLQIAEIEAGIQRRSFKPCALADIVADVAQMYEALAEEKNVSLHYQQQDSAIVHGDANLLASALANVVDNAVKYAASRVVIEVTGGDGIGRVVIQDDGPGLPAAEYEHMGKHFYRLDSEVEGHGLGLTSVQGIVGLHGGKLAFADAGPGLRVTVSIPLISRQAGP